MSELRELLDIAFVTNAPRFTNVWGQEGNSIVLTVLDAQGNCTQGCESGTTCDCEGLVLMDLTDISGSSSSCEYSFCGTAKGYVNYVAPSGLSEPSEPYELFSKCVDLRVYRVTVFWPSGYEGVGLGVVRRFN